MTDMTDFDSLIDKLASNAVPVRARSVRTGRLALAALSVATLLAVLGTYGFRSDVREFCSWTFEAGYWPFRASRLVGRWIGSCCS